MKRYGTSQFVYTACGTRKAMYVRELYRSIQRVYKNAVCIIVLPLGCGTAMRVFKILHLLCEVPQDIIVCVHSQCHPYGDVH